ncbi:hypothetical protein G6N74_06835 [Mesorhizobium sp. CGMCC 1.15528]|uniref:Uncharacterized protein n=1 Tax=Mesorhizobium zhangyense TaxID=1776730 RepID=A0A7C9R5U8_9HYPH|nr:hypothetical protein [Mesorhizobium zhangyense]
MQFVIPKTAAKRRFSGIYWSQHRQARPGPDIDAHSVPLKLVSVPAWIPDTLRSFLAHEVENDELHLGLVVNLRRWPLGVDGLALTVCDGSK